MNGTFTNSLNPTLWESIQPGVIMVAEAAGPFLARRGLFHLWPIDDPGGENGWKPTRGWNSVGT